VLLKKQKRILVSKKSFLKPTFTVISATTKTTKIETTEVTTMNTDLFAIRNLRMIEELEAEEDE
jgi:hypothetical protein